MGVSRIEGGRVNLNAGQGAIALGGHLDRTAACGGVNGSLGQAVLDLFDLLLHFSSLFDELT
ncbi:hypothetical protein SDC9_167686 [bioreactor metagenome]|uniref:Uncharacterized protein n=1 Tax=bioreactor metagenome TaxID=1076179 RepID=A0A645G0F1_9ZZZZ